MLLDKGALIEPAAQLRPYYPNILQTVRETKRDLVMSGAGRAESKLDDPVGVIGEFLEFVREEGADEAELGVMKQILELPQTEDVQ